MHQLKGGLKLKTTAQKMTLFALTWPIFIEMLLHMFMGNSDTLMLSMFSDSAVAAVGVSNQILYVLIVMFGFVATGTAILVAQNLGANLRKSASEIAVLAILANLAFGLVISAFVFFFSKPLLSMMNLPAELMPQARSYLNIVGGFMFVEALIMTVGAILRSYGFTRDSMFVTIGMNILNVVGNSIFIFGLFGMPVLGVEGVALSTIVSRMIGLVVIIVLLFKRIEEPLPFRKFMGLPKGHLKNLLKIGVPSAGEHLAYNASQIIITYFIAEMGTDSLTTKVYAWNLMMVVLVFSISISEGTRIMVGYMIGANEYDSAYKRCINSLKISLVLTTVMATVCYLIARPVFSIFTDNQEIIAMGVTLMLLTIILEPGRAFNLVIINSLKAAGDVKFPVYMGILSMLGVSVTISYVLGIHFGLGLVGVWISFIADEWFRGLIMLFRWRSRVWETKSFVKNEPVSVNAV
ncbi:MULTISPECIES: MATE family efflux transporter [unclassified Bacillus (in: firmicutes)]|uniref:MATE family efflux transporter n=1 Tax=unclassified Bacillus (in: firmicutes) TaxID=185979 RepID=UPI0008E66DDF|nr:MULTISPECIES: MATE family efflux transporter [unclassified Bacillus (in: firmicutes)]SFB11723.1 putative efflux protein, MATE family [Bacillus sp. UNCCL13]SFQ90453.1 putative efflux protein, MATE family [Bacillus sp. cl95]